MEIEGCINNEYIYSDSNALKKIHFLCYILYFFLLELQNNKHKARLNKENKENM